ncbi:MAG: ATP-binding protein [Filomicrobium sp.]
MNFRTTGFDLEFELKAKARWVLVLLGVAPIAVVFGQLDFASSGNAIGLAAASLIPGARLGLGDKPLLREGEAPSLPNQVDVDPKGAQPSHATESWRAIVDALPYPALTLDTNGIVTHQNKILANLFPQMRQGSAMGQLLRSPDLASAVGSTVETGKTMIVHIIERVPVARTIEATITRLELEAAAARLLVTFRDLTEREKVEQMRADFVANASHELRTPLASLKGYIETLQGPARDDEKARDRFLSIMWSQSLRMSRLVDDLLSLSRVEMRAHLAPQGKADLNEVAAFVVQSLEPLAVSQGATLILKPFDGEAFIRADREEIVQALQNLVHNALKYGRSDGCVTIEVGRTESALDEKNAFGVSVKDDGPGIEHHHIPRLVERFYRINANSSREKGGTGLGLAIVKHIMLRHRGDLKISSEVGKGSEFKLEFGSLN